MISIDNLVACMVTVLFRNCTKFETDETQQILYALNKQESLYSTFSYTIGVRQYMFTGGFNPNFGFKNFRADKEEHRLYPRIRKLAVVNKQVNEDKQIVKELLYGLLNKANKYEDIKALFPSHYINQINQFIHHRLELETLISSVLRNKTDLHAHNNFYTFLQNNQKNIDIFHNYTTQLLVIK